MPATSEAVVPAAEKPPPSHVFEQVALAGAEENVDYFEHHSITWSGSLSSFSRCGRVFSSRHARRALIFMALRDY
ncbi:hypothetical protein D4R89_13840 [bacterium]|nr:MAG: hypothetical protein D4R89_13840 [bacterium]